MCSSIQFSNINNELTVKRETEDHLTGIILCENQFFRIDFR